RSGCRSAGCSIPSSRATAAGSAGCCADAAARVGDDRLRRGAVAPASRLRLLRRLEVLVALEEVLDLVAQLGIDVVDVAYALERRVAERHAQHLLVGTLLVAHVEDPDRPDADATAGKRRFRDEDERVERVRALREGSREVAEFRRKRHRVKEET